MGDKAAAAHHAGALSEREWVHDVKTGATRASAVISPDAQYRYELGRFWRDDPEYLAGDTSLRRAVLPVVMLNPSTANAFVDDPTIRRCVSFAKRNGYGGLVVTNLYGLRSTSPLGLRSHHDPVGPENDAYLRQLLEYAQVAHCPVLCAWGNNAKLERVQRFGELARNTTAQLVALGISKSGAPKHPLYIAGATPFQPLELP